MSPITQSIQHNKLWNSDSKLWLVPKTEFQYFPVQTRTVFRPNLSVKRNAGFSIHFTEIWPFVCISPYCIFFQCHTSVAIHVKGHQTVTCLIETNHISLLPDNGSCYLYCHTPTAAQHRSFLPDASRPDCWIWLGCSPTSFVLPKTMTASDIHVFDWLWEWVIKPGWSKQD